MGVGIAGHSMGGQAVAASSADNCTRQYDIRAAVSMLSFFGDYGEGNIGGDISIPTLYTTSMGDFVTGQMARPTFDAQVRGPKVFRNSKNWDHLEPVLWPPTQNPYLSTFTAWWFDYYLKKIPEAREHFYGNGTDSLCNHEPMEECILVEDQ